MSLDELLLHSKTRDQLEIFLNQPANALMLSGRAGSGKKTIARQLAADLLGVEVGRILNHPQLILITKPEDKTEISIDAIRQLINSVTLRVADDTNRPINRVAIIENAHFMSREAQNALLKLLEEPPLGTALILTTDSQDNLLPTVVSRARNLSVIAPSLEQSLKYFDKYGAQKTEGAWQLSQGGAGLLSALLADEADHPLKLAVEQSKEFIKQDTYHRLIYLQQISKDRANFPTFLEALAKVLGALHTASIKNGRTKDAQRILRSRQAVEKAIMQLNHSANIRLLSLALALNIPL
jgi:hypothetical protein